MKITADLMLMRREWYNAFYSLDIGQLDYLETDWFFSTNTVVAYSMGLSEEQNHWVTLSSRILNYVFEPGVSQEGRAVLCKGARLKYRFINEHRTVWGVMTMCRVLCVARAGFYAWLHNPVSARDKDNQRLLTLIRDSYSLSGGVYGYRRVHGDLNEIGETCGKNRVGRIMQLNRIKAVRGYKAPRRIAGRPSLVAPNRVQRQFTVVRANQVWVTDITYIRTWQGWLYLAVVIDLFARNVVGWSMKPTLSRELALDALMMAVWRRKPDGEVIVHSDQGSQYGSDDWQRFCRANNLTPSMSRRGNCWDNAVAESFFSSLKKERIRKRIYKTRDLARADIFDYIECSTTGPGATVISAASVRRPSNRPRREDRICLRAWGQSSRLVSLSNLGGSVQYLLLSVCGDDCLTPLTIQINYICTVTMYVMAMANEKYGAV